MKLRFFHVESNIIHHANRSRVLGAWERRKPWDQSSGKQVLKLITVVCDDKLHPVHVYLMKLALDDGWITDESRRDSVKFITAEERWGGGTRKQRAAWITALKEQLWCHSLRNLQSIPKIGKTRHAQKRLARPPTPGDHRR